MTATETDTPWADRFRAARKAAGFSSSERFALHIGASRRTALRWETGEALPRDYADAIAAVSPELAELVAELPAEDHRRNDLAGRVEELERQLAELRSAFAAGAAEVRRARPASKSRRLKAKSRPLTNE